MRTNYPLAAILTLASGAALAQTTPPMHHKTHHHTHTRHSIHRQHR